MVTLRRRAKKNRVIQEVRSRPVSKTKRPARSLPKDADPLADGIQYLQGALAIPSSLLSEPMNVPLELEGFDDPPHPPPRKPVQEVQSSELQEVQSSKKTERPCPSVTPPKSFIPLHQLAHVPFVHKRKPRRVRPDRRMKYYPAGTSRGWRLNKASPKKPGPRPRTPIELRILRCLGIKPTLVPPSRRTKRTP